MLRTAKTSRVSAGVDPHGPVRGGFVDVIARNEQGETIGFGMATAVIWRVGGWWQAANITASPSLPDHY